MDWRAEHMQAGAKPLVQRRGGVPGGETDHGAHVYVDQGCPGCGLAATMSAPSCT